MVIMESLERSNSLLNLVDEEFALTRRPGYVLFLKGSIGYVGVRFKVSCGKADTMVDTKI